VVLPAPDVPVIVVTSPAGMKSETFRSTCFSSKAKETFRKLMPRSRVGSRVPVNASWAVSASRMVSCSDQKALSFCWMFWSYLKISIAL
jgi:hypothetical protein